MQSSSQMLHLVAAALLIGSARGLDNGLATTPPMGWNRARASPRTHTHPR